ncbi:MAG: DNA translocase FtsK, partial [Clostridia bacterium]|nr:DNA translocase FtsK [Clostridia bacterium]
AEKLLNNGDMLFAPVGVPKPLRVQGAFVSDSEVEKVTSFLKQNTPAGAYNRDIMEDIEREAEKCAQNGKRGSSSDDVASAEEGDETLKNPKFREACEVAIDEGKISTSLLQRRLKIGFGKAARFIDIMQRMGIVSSPDGQKPRTTLMTRDQFYELLNHADDRSEE